MNWLKSFLGLYEKRYAKKEIETSKYIEQEKIKFEEDMGKLKMEAKEVHKDIKKSREEAIRLNETVSDITTKIAMATGSYKIVKE